MPLTSRLCKNGFLQSWLDYTEPQESPELFHFWAVVSVLAMTLGRKCYMNRGYFTCYPNQYIVLLSESARCRKTVASDLAVDLYKDAVLPNFFKGTITSRGVTKYLSNQTQQKGESPLFLYSGELGRLLKSDDRLLDLLTDFYSCPTEDEVVTATQGCDKVKNVFINLLGATVPQFLSTVPGDMVEGGFSSRTIFIVQNKPRPPRSRPTVTPSMQTIYNNLVQDLRHIFTLSGEFKWTKEAMITYDNWYNKAYYKIDDHDLRLRAYHARKGEHVLKLSMILSASASDDMIIQHYDIENSLLFLKQVEVSMPTAFRGVSFSDSTKHIDRILQQVQEQKGRIEHSALLRKNRYHLDSEELKKIINSLLEMNLIRMEVKGVKKWYCSLD